MQNGRAADQPDFLVDFESGAVLGATVQSKQNNLLAVSDGEMFGWRYRQLETCSWSLFRIKTCATP